MMSDKDLLAIRQRRMEELRKKRIADEQQNNFEIDTTQILNKLFRGRAWEVFNASASQFPLETSKIKKLLIKLALEKKISQINGEQIFALIRQLGLPLKLNTSINYFGKGKIKSLSEKFKESNLTYE